MKQSEEPPHLDESLIQAMHITTPDQVFGWVILIDDETVIRVGVDGNRFLEKAITQDQDTSIGFEAWNMVIHTLGLDGPRDQYKVREVSTRIPRALTERIVASETDKEQNEVICELAIYIGKEIKLSDSGAVR